MVLTILINMLVKNMIDKNDLVSIIVPIYNAEDSLHNCIESVLEQTYPHIELILVNDGSTDLSKKICNHYVSLDERIKVIHQENAGPSSARNRGIEYAIGDYVQFVDADDYIKPNMTETLLQAMSHDVQLVICGYQSIHFDFIRQYIPAITGVYPKSDFMQHIAMFYKDILLPSPCNKMYVKSLINECRLHFPEDVKVGEDLLFNLAYLKVCSMIHVIDQPLYNYIIQDDQSLSRDFSKEFYSNQYMLHQQVRSFLQQENFYVGKNKYFLNVIYANSIINSLSNLFHQNSAFTPQEKKRQIEKIISDIDLEQEVYFKDSMQARIVGQMIKKKSTQRLYLFFKMKMSPLTQRLKEILIAKKGEFYPYNK